MVDKDLINYPVYQMTGETQHLQKNCMEYLKAELESNYNLSCAVFSHTTGLDCYALLQAIKQNDLVIFCGPVDFPVKQIRIGYSLAYDRNTLVWDEPDGRPASGFIKRLVCDLSKSLEHTPVWACVLIGGKSSRMGQPKHMLKNADGRTWLERLVASIKPSVVGLAFSGQGELPASLQDIPRLPDIPGVVGPLNGILSAGRWQPYVSWLLLACDMPDAGREGVDWLLSDRSVGCWGRVPQMAEAKYVEPLFAWYDFRAISLFERQLGQGDFKIGRIASHAKIEKPIVPESLRNNWQNVNTPEQLQAFTKK